MKKTQIKIIKDTEKFRPEPKYPVYPPYHEGLYIEDYFFNYFTKNKINTDRIYLPIFWTSLYCNETYTGSKFDIQSYLDTLDPDIKYFTICQHEHAPAEILPKNTLVFSASGKIHQNNKSNNHIPIPLLCSKIKNPILDKKRDILCSFVGAKTHKLRETLFNTFKDDTKFYFNMGNWEPSVPKYKEDEFKSITERSIFTLCPRGDGPTSFRLYESMQLGSIPVYVYDSTKWIPYENEINWSDLCIFIHENEIPHIKEILENTPQERIDFMKGKINQVYDEYFSLKGMCNKIIEKLDKEKMRLLTCYSDSHSILFENYFYPSVKKINEYDIILQKYEQIGDGSFMNDGWKNSTYRKIDFLIQMVIDCWGDVFIFSDSDIIFIDKTKDYLLEQLGESDVCFQRDYDDLCSGFFIMKSNINTLTFLQNCIKNKDKYPEDQTAFRGEKELINYKLLPNEIFNIGMINGGKVWDGEFYEIPQNILIFHANWSIGIKAKIGLFNLIIENLTNKDLSFLKRKNDDMSFYRFDDGSIFVGNVQSGRMINGYYLKEENEILLPDNKNSNKKLKVNVYFNYFDAKTEKRSNEIKYCLNKVISNKKIDKIYLLCSDNYTEWLDKKIVKIDMFNIQPTFDDIFNIVNFNTKNDDLNILLNSDCFIDEENIDLILNNIKNRMVYCLSRWNIIKLTPFKSEHFDINCSQDAWCFLGEIDNLKCNFKMGMPGCDNALAYEFDKSGYVVVNPSKDVKVYHYHFSDIRTYGVSHEEKEKNRIKRPYKFISTSFLNENLEIETYSTFNKFVDEVYVINLERRKDRLEHITKEFKKIDVSFKRVNAIDGNDIEKFNNLSSAEIACLRSHVGVIQESIEKNYKRIAIFEDDIIFCDDFEKRFEYYSSNIPDDWDIMYLGGTHYGNGVEVKPFINKIEGVYGCFAMILNNKNNLFQKIIEITKSENIPIDNYYCENLSKTFNTYIFVPFFVKTLNTKSDISIRKESFSYENEVDVNFKNIVNLKIDKMNDKIKELPKKVFKENILNSFVDNIYCINLQRRKDKLTHIMEQFKKIDLDSFQIIKAVDGQKLKDNLPIKRKGEIGCLRSHLIVLQDAIDRKYDKIAIFEDDVIFCDDFKSRFDYYIKNVPDDWDIMYLGNDFPIILNPVIMVKKMIYRVWKSKGCFAMILNNKNGLFQKIIDISKNEEKTIDSCIEFLFPQLKCYTFIPFFVKISDIKSDINEISIYPNIDKYFKNKIDLPNIIENVNVQKHIDPVIVKTHKEMCEDHLKLKGFFMIYYNNVIVFDSSTSGKENVIFFDDHFEVFGRRFSYRGMFIKRK